MDKIRRGCPQRRFARSNKSRRYGAEDQGGTAMRSRRYPTKSPNRMLVRRLPSAGTSVPGAICDKRATSKASVVATRLVPIPAADVGGLKPTATSSSYYAANTMKLESYCGPRWALIVRLRIVTRSVSEEERHFPR